MWGTGTPRREFLYRDDKADAFVFLMGLSDERYTGLVGSGVADFGTAAVNPTSAAIHPPTK